jgi:DNA invertase Pin-like site-specific DNA recombinase
MLYPQLADIRAAQGSQDSLRAAQYVRMSTDLQQYSIQNQMESIAAYALRRNITIVRSYADEGRSGLRLDDRPALTQLLNDVQTGAADFDAILVYDVSRWGRFQDIDESAYYEQLCKRAGTRVIYCAETFENDDSLISALIKSLKRAMAGEYSRELSAKVFVGHCNFVRRGFWQGAAPGYGLRRLLISANGAPKGILARGERKNIQSDRVILVPGPQDEVRTIRRVFHSFVKEQKTYLQIARELNADGVTYIDDRPWNYSAVRKILISEKYAGHNVYGRVSRKLNGTPMRNAPEVWVRAPHAFAPIIDQVLLSAAIRMDQKPGVTRMSLYEIVRRLKLLYAKEGRLSCRLIDDAPDLPRSSLIRKRFGNMRAAYEKAGFHLPPVYDHHVLRRSLADKFTGFVAQIVADLGAAGLDVVPSKWRRTFLIGGDHVVVMRVVRPTFHRSRGSPQWILSNGGTCRSDYIVAIRTRSIDYEPIDYYLLPSVALPPKHVRLGGRTWRHLERYRYGDRADLVHQIRQVALDCVETSSGLLTDAVEPTES